MTATSKVEIGGRIKARFNQNFWTNFGGFGPQEEDERSAQYMKLRGVWVRVTPGYDWIDSATIRSGSDHSALSSYECCSPKSNHCHRLE